MSGEDPGQLRTTPDGRCTRSRRASQLSELVASSGLSRREIAKRSDVGRSTIQDAVSGKRLPRQDNPLAIVRACRVSGPDV
jgi:transposase